MVQSNFEVGKCEKHPKALGRVVHSGSEHMLFKPHTEESTTKRGGLESLIAKPKRPIASFSPNSCWAAAKSPGY